MAKHLAYKRTESAGQIEFNMTPMIDCTFQLIIFFILASQMASDSLAKLDLHRPDHSQAIPAEQIEMPNKVIVNVLSAEVDDSENPAMLGRASRYEINGKPFPPGNVSKLAEILRKKKAACQDEEARENFLVEIRADHRVSFGDVEPVMIAAAEAGIVKMNLTALTAVIE